jgi:ArsR family transcriptional regulator
MNNLVKLFRVLGDETRLRILRLLRREELNVQEVVEVLRMVQSRVSHHLKGLREAGLIADRREGTWTYYRLRRTDEMDERSRALVALVGQWLTGLDEHAEDIERLGEVMEARKRPTRTFFDEKGMEWDRIRSGKIADVPALAAVMALLPGEAVAADVGTGTGELLVRLARNCRRAIGVDNSERMLSAARERIRSEHLKNVELRLGDVDALPLGDGEVDAVFAGMVLHHCPRPAHAVAEMSRALRAGGALVLIDLAKHAEEWVRREMADLWLGFERDEVRRFFEDAGLVRFEFIDHDFAEGRSKKPRLRTFVAIGRKG